MGTQGAGRKRTTNKERSTAEDDALNLIAREAEARLAAKRAARAEAREIRMKELERQQKELSDDDERMSVGSRGSVRVEDRDYLEKGSRAASALTAATLTSLGGTSSRRGSGETSITVDAETSIREIKDALVEVEEKYRKAMVSNAQLDNEKNNLMYQVDTLKDSLMELEELLSESRREYEEKVKEYEREKHAHGVLQFQFTEMKETLKQSEELLNKHGIVLGPDLNINGDASGTQTDGDSGPPAAQETQAPPTDGNSMLGSTEELRRSREEEADPRERHPDTLQEGTGDLSSNQLGNVADVDAVEREMCSNRQDVGDEDSQAEVNELPAVDEMVCGPQVEGSENSPEENVAGTSSSGGRVSGGDVLEMANSPAVEQENEEARKRESRPSVAEVAKEEFISEAHQEPENAEEISSKVQPGGSAPGKKKKKKRRGKKKGVPHEERKQQRDVKEEDGSDQENSKSEKENESVSAAERDIDGHVTVNKSKMDEVNEQQDTEETNAVEPAESQAESLEEPRVEPLPDEQNDKLHSEDSDLPAAIVTHDQVPEEDPEPNNNAATESGSPGHNGTCDNSELIPEQTLEPENMEEVMSCAAEADRTEGVRSLEDGSSIDPLRPAGQVCLSGTFEEGGAESHVQSHVDAAVEPVNSSESETKASLEPTDDITDGLKSPSGSELLSDLPAAIDAHIQVPEAVPETDNDAATDSGSPGTDNGTSDNSELKRHLSEEEELSEVAPVKQENSMTATQASDLDEAGIQMCLVDKSNTEASSETELIDPDGPEEPGTKQDHQDEGSFTQDDPEHGSGQNDSGRKDSCLPPQQDSEEEDGDEEGQSFDFDDMDVEAAIEINDPEQEDLEEGVEVVADKSDDGRSRETEPVGDEDQRRSGDDVEEDDSASQNKLKSQEDTTSETRQTQGTEQGNVPDAKDENVEEAAVEEEGLDAVKQELQGGEDVVLPKSPSQVGRNKESALSGKDVKKNGKKGKSKGKEECKMS
ncbi:uncharacterized protein lrrfip1a isoform 2-T2 [Aulostomus maculatus]